MHHRSTFAQLCLHCVVSMVTGLQVFNGFRQFLSSSQSCESVSWVIQRRTLLQSVTARSKSDCIQLCANEIACVDAVLYWNDGDVSKSCNLFAYKKWEDQSLSAVDNCFYITMKPCYNNGQYVDGLCRCPSGFTGIYCELSNEAFCSETHQMVHEVQGTSSTSFTYLTDGRTTLDALKAHNCKASADSLVPNHVSIGVPTFQHSRNGIWGTQVLDSLTVKTGTSGVEFDSPATIDGMMVKSTGQLESLRFDLDHSTPTRLFFYGNNKVYVRPSEGELVMDGTSGSVDDVIQAAKKGYEPIGVPAVLMYDEPLGTVVLKGSRHEMAITNPHTYQIPMYFYNVAFDGNIGKMRVYREKLYNTDNFGTYTESTAWIFNPCWYESTFDGRQPWSPSTVHLQRALQEGHRVRVVYEGVSSRVKVVYITAKYVLFQISPYVSPKHSFNMDFSSDVVHSLVSSSGRVKSCLNKMGQSAAVSHEDYVITNGDDIHWYVDSRQWELLYRTDMSGQHQDGQFSLLKQAVTEGADVHIVLELHSGTLFMAMLAEMVHVGDTAITAEIKSMAEVSVSDSDFTWPDSTMCAMVNYLIDTHNGVKGIRYTYGTGPVEEHLSLTSEAGFVYWFISR